jgi:uncharacterized protein (DUF2147 family)
MKPFTSLFAILFIANISFAQSANSILGKWLSEKKESKIEIYQQGGKYYGKIVWTKTDGIKDDKNPDATLKSRPLLGLLILTNLESDGDNEWDNGKIYDPVSGKTYSCNASLVDGKLRLRGFVGISLFGRTSVWTRN